MLKAFSDVRIFFAPFDGQTWNCRIFLQKIVMNNIHVKVTIRT
jgi:hypothetical protein